MEESTNDPVADAIESVRGYLRTQLEALEDPRNVHTVRERLYGRRWAEQVDAEQLPEGLEAGVTQELERAWTALSRYPWDLHGAQQALEAALARATG